MAGPRPLLGPGPSTPMPTPAPAPSCWQRAWGSTEQPSHQSLPLSQKPKEISLRRPGSCQAASQPRTAVDHLNQLPIKNRIWKANTLTRHPGLEGFSAAGLFTPLNSFIRSSTMRSSTIKEPSSSRGS